MKVEDRKRTPHQPSLRSYGPTGPNPLPVWRGEGEAAAGRAAARPYRVQGFNARILRGILSPFPGEKEGCDNRAARARFRGTSAFTLLEVMLAVGIFFAGVFTVLSLVSASLSNARRLQRPLVDAGALAAQLSLTNQLVKGVDSGNLGDVLGDAYKNYTWTHDIQEVQKDRFYQVYFVIQDAYGNHDAVDKISVLFYRPLSPPGSLDEATVNP